MSTPQKPKNATTFRAGFFKEKCGPSGTHSIGFFGRYDGKTEWERELGITGMDIAKPDKLKTVFRIISGEEFPVLSGISAPRIVERLKSDMKGWSQSWSAHIKGGTEISREMEIIPGVLLIVRVNDTGAANCQIEIDGARCTLESPEQLEELRKTIAESQFY